MDYPVSASPDPLGIDFRTLHLLSRVHALRSFTRTAEETGLNQSAVSYTIDKLRQVFGDPLFVRQGRSIRPTPRCDAIVAEAQTLIAAYRQMTLPQSFDPATATGRFVIACNYYERVLWVPRIVRALRLSAPGIALEIVDASGIGQQRLLDGEADLLIGPVEAAAPLLHSTRLYEESYVCLMDRQHPAARAPLDLDTYLALDHVLVTYGGRWTSRYITDLAAAGHNLRIALRVPSPAGLEELVEASDLVATVPARLSSVTRRGVHVTPCPMPTRIAICTAWTAANHHSAQHIWIREKIRDVITTAT